MFLSLLFIQNFPNNLFLQLITNINVSYISYVYIYICSSYDRKQKGNNLGSNEHTYETLHATTKYKVYTNVTPEYDFTRRDLISNIRENVHI